MEFGKVKLSIEPRRRAELVLGRLLPFIVCVEMIAAELDASRLPPPSEERVEFDRDVKPIFEKSCFRCHGPERPKSRFRLDNRESALKGGENNKDDIVPGQSAQSKLIYYVARMVEDMEMPPAGKGDPLTAGQISVLRAWIDQGAKWPPGAETTARETQFSITPMAQWIGVSGNKQKFREDWGVKEGFTAGYEHFEMRQPIGKEADLWVDGRALFDQNDYRVALTLIEPDVGFVRGGYETYRKYFNDTSGFYALSNQPPPSLDRELYLEIGKAWFDAALTLPDWPKLVAGYEYHFRNGNESTLQWGQYSSDPTAFFGKALFPGYKTIGEHAHILKLDLAHEIGGYALEDNFRAEFYELSTTRVNRGDFSDLVIPPDRIGEHNENYRHFQAANGFRAEKQLRDWFLLSGGYLYTHLEGDGAFSQAFSSSSSAYPPSLGDSSERISLNQQSHAVSANALLGPWEGFTLSSGIQSEWTHNEGSVDLFATNVVTSAGEIVSGSGEPGSDRDRTALDENVALRYTRIPFTVLYAEAHFQQERIDYYEQQFLTLNGSTNTGSFDFIRDTEATGDLHDYRAGFTFSPWARVSFEPSYEHRVKQTDYHHEIDLPSPMSNGYPAFIRSREITTDQIEAKVVLRLMAWLKTTLKYQLVSTDYRTDTDPTPLLNTPGGALLAGNYDAHVYSANVTLTPWRRLYLSTTFSYSQSRLVSGDNELPAGQPAVVPNKGDIYTVLASANFAVSRSTDFRAIYTYSRADYRQHNESGGLPLGLVYDRHGVTAGVTRRLLKNMTGTLQYGFFRYSEPVSAGVNNYRAHAVLASLNIALP
ncbi:MAG TPA: c-type cytochrome domain-containing protein [Haliangiales bacterium]|nr:c-type cytochrome domain-containing protein [Haliangiales bacterium]